MVQSLQIFFGDDLRSFIRVSERPCNSSQPAKWFLIFAIFTEYFFGDDLRSFVYLNALAIQVGLPNGFYFLQSLQNIFLVMIFVRSFVYMNALQFKLACRMVSNFCYYLACILMRFSSPSLSSLMLFSASLLSIRRFSYLEDFIIGLIDRQMDRQIDRYTRIQKSKRQKEKQINIDKVCL